MEWRWQPCWLSKVRTETIVGLTWVNGHRCERHRQQCSALKGKANGKDDGERRLMTVGWKGTILWGFQIWQQWRHYWTVGAWAVIVVWNERGKKRKKKKKEEGSVWLNGIRKKKDIWTEWEWGILCDRLWVWNRNRIIGQSLLNWVIFLICW